MTPTPIGDPPVVSSSSPTKASSGDVVVITGTYDKTETASVEVIFNGVDISGQVTFDASAGAFTLTITAPGTIPGLPNVLAITITAGASVDHDVQVIP